MTYNQDKKKDTQLKSVQSQSPNGAGATAAAQEQANLRSQVDQLKQAQSMQQNSGNGSLQSMQQNSGKSGYQQSDAVNNAKNALDSLQKPGEYNSTWQQSVDDAINKILNRGKFSYDLNGDALYQQYKDRYVTQGQQAMMDTMGQASALTGGYGSSYAQAAGQQTYQGYLQQLNDKVPELYQLALDQYNREGEDLYNQYGMLTDREATEYGRYRDQVSDYNTERDYLTGRFDTERGFDYQDYRNNIEDSHWEANHELEVNKFDHSKDMDYKNYDLDVDKFEQEQYEFETNTDLTREQMDTQKEQWQAEFDQGVKEFDQEYSLKVQQIEEDIRHNKITEAQGQAQIDLAKDELAQQKEEFKQEMSYKYAALNKSSGSSGGGGGGSSGGSKSSGGSGSGSGSGGSGGSGGGGVSPTNTKAATSFIANNMTSSEFMARGKTYSEYESYIKNKLNSANLTPGEFAYLESYYKLN